MSMVVTKKEYFKLYKLYKERKLSKEQLLTLKLSFDFYKISILGLYLKSIDKDFYNYMQNLNFKDI